MKKHQKVSQVWQEQTDRSGADFVSWGLHTWESSISHNLGYPTPTPPGQWREESMEEPNFSAGIAQKGCQRETGSPLAASAGFRLDTTEETKCSWLHSRNSLTQALRLYVNQSVCCETGDKVIIESGLTMNELLLRNAYFTALIYSGCSMTARSKLCGISVSSYPNYHRGVARWMRTAI